MKWRKQIPNALRTFTVSACMLLFCRSSALTAAESVVNPPIQVGGSVDALHDTSVTDAEIGFKLIFNAMLVEANESFSIKIYDSHEELLENFKSGKIQAVYTSSLKLLELGDWVHPTGRYVVQYGPYLKQRYLLLVRNNQKIANLADLRGKKLSIAAGHVVGERFLNVKLLQQGLTESEQFFGEIERVKEVNTAVVNLFFGQADAALVPEFSYELACELNPQLRSSISVFFSSSPMVYEVIGLRYDFPQERIDRIEPHIFGIELSKRIERLFKTFRVNRLYRLNEETLKEVIELNKTYYALSHKTL